MANHSGFTATGDINMGGNEIVNFDLATESAAGSATTAVSDNTGVIEITGTGTAISKMTTCRDGRVLYVVFTNATPNTITAAATPASDEFITALSPTQNLVYRFVGYNDGSYIRWYLQG